MKVFIKLTNFFKFYLIYDFKSIIKLFKLKKINIYVIILIKI